MASPLTENQRLWLHAMYASEYAWVLQQPMPKPAPTPDEPRKETEHA